MKELTAALWAIARIGFPIGCVALAVIIGAGLLGWDQARVTAQYVFMVAFLPLFAALFVLMILHHFRLNK